MSHAGRIPLHGSQSGLSLTDPVLTNNRIYLSDGRVIDFPLGKWIDVTSHGAKGDGTTDDTSAIQAAIDAASAGDVVFFPSGTYNYTRLTVNKRVHLLGFARDVRNVAGATIGVVGTRLHCTGTTFPAVTIGQVGVNTDGLSIRGLVFSFDLTASADPMIDVVDNTTPYLLLEDVAVLNYGTRTGIGIDFGDSNDQITLSRVHIEGFTTGARFAGSNGPVVLGNVYTFGNTTGVSFGIGAANKGIAGISVLGGAFNDQLVSLEFVGGANTIAIYGAYFENNVAGSRAISIPGHVTTGQISNVLIDGCYFQGGSVGEYAIKIDRVNGLKVRNVVAVNEVSGLVENLGTAVAGVVLEDNSISGGGSTITSSWSGIARIESAEPYAGRWYHNVAQSIPNANATILSFNSGRSDPHGIKDVGNTKFYARVPGWYYMNLVVQWANNTTGNRELLIRLNGTTWIARTRWMAVTDGTYETLQSLSTIYYLNVGDYVECLARQTSTVALNVDAVGNYSPEFSMAKL